MTARSAPPAPHSESPHTEDRRRLVYLILVMTGAVALSGGIGLYLLYRASFSEQTARLTEAVAHRARLIESIARFDAKFSDGDAGSAEAATLAQILDAHQRSEGFGETGEYVLARRSGDEIVFVLSLRHVEVPKRIPFYHARNAEPMRRALSGASGSMLGIDYRGERVLAAYEPVAVLNLGLVAKIDLSEIRAPFLDAAMWAGLAALAGILIGSFFFVRLTSPLMVRLAESQLQLRQAQKLESIGRLAAGVAHDFNNLLMGINGCADVAVNRLDADSPARVYLQEIKNSVSSGAAITRQLLTFSRLSEGSRANVALDSVLTEAEPLLKRLLGAGIDFRIEPGTGDAGVPCERGHVEQILMNLVVNARDAMPRGGRLTLSTSEVNLDAAEAGALGELTAGRYVKLEVSDTGIGMSPETLEHLFEPFFTTKDDLSGTGLGLSTVYGIVRNAGGHIDVRSRPTRGTRFEIYLPAVAKHVEPPQSPAEVPPVEDASILVVEDDPMVRMSVKHYLEERGYSLAVAGDGPEALRCIRMGFSPALLLTDIVLPGGAGPLVARAVLALVPGVRVLYMSAHPAEVHVESGRLAAGTPVLQKPFSEQELLATVRIALGAPPGPGGRSLAPALEAHRAAQPAGPGPQGRTLLLVEDDAVARSASRELLQDLGYNVLAAADGADALQACRGCDGPVHLLITDFRLPDTTGDRVATEVRRMKPGVGVVFISGLPPTSEGLREALKDPGTAFIQKPVDFDVVEQTLRDLLRNA